MSKPLQLYQLLTITIAVSVGNSLPHCVTHLDHQSVFDSHRYSVVLSYDIHISYEIHVSECDTITDSINDCQQELHVQCYGEYECISKLIDNIEWHNECDNDGLLFSYYKHISECDTITDSVNQQQYHWQ